MQPETHAADNQLLDHFHRPSPLRSDMNPTVLALPTLEQLSEHVHQTLCSRDFLDPKQTPMITAILVRASRPCGMTFHVQGLRQVQISAIWTAQENRILFYDSTGSRFAETKLVESPDPRKLAA